jgi:hypothetical protein
MVVTLEITRAQRTKLKNLFKLYGKAAACHKQTKMAYTTLNNFLKLGYATKETIEKIESFVGYKLELKEEEKQPV